MGCNFNAKDKNNTNVFPVISTLSSVSCEWYENPELNEKAGIKKMGTVHLCFDLSNPNDFPVYIPIHNHKDSMYKSHIETYLKGKRLTTENKVLRVLYHEGIQFVDIKIYDINEYNHYKDFEDAKKIISDLEFKYIKDESDSIYRKMKVGDMRFDTDDYLKVIYKIPKDEVDVIWCR